MMIGIKYNVNKNIVTCFSVQVLIKPKPVFQTAVVSEQTRQLVTETLQQVTRAADLGQGQTSGPDGSTKEESGSSASEGSHGGTQGKPHLPSSFC